MKLRVYYEDTDAGGIVYHTNYIKYCERARSEMFFSKNKLPTDGEQSGFVVRDLQAKFIGMAGLGDILSVTSEIIEEKSASVILRQSITKDEKKIFSMDITLVFVREGKPCKIPEEMKEILR